MSRNLEDWIVITESNKDWSKGRVIQPFSYNIRNSTSYRVCTGEAIHVSDDASFIAEYGIKYIPKTRGSKLSLELFLILTVEIAYCPGIKSTKQKGLT